MADMRLPDRRELRRLYDWTPPHGVLSVYLRVDPADRGEGWRVELREGLERAVEEAGGEDEDRRRAIEATADGVLARFGAGELPSGRLQVGFCEVSADRGRREAWFAAQLLRETEVVHARRPHLAPLLEIIEEGAPVGVLAVSAERVQLLEWSFGFIEEVESWEIVLSSPTWRERKSPAPRDPSAGHGPGASGHDQFDQRLDANRSRFLEQVGAEAAAISGGRDWRALLGFGNAHHIDLIRKGAGRGIEIETVSEANVLDEDRRALAERIGHYVLELGARREQELADRAEAAALSSDGRGALGLRETTEALREGRVQHLLVDGSPGNGMPADTIGELIELALHTDAEITPIAAWPASEKIRAHEGVAALLRY